MRDTYDQMRNRNWRMNAATTLKDLSKLLFVPLLVFGSIQLHGQSLSTTCSNNLVAGASCTYVMSASTSSALDNLTVQYGILIGGSNPVLDPVDNKWKKRYTYTWASTGTFTQCIKEGGTCLYSSSTVTIYPAVGPLTVTRTSGAYSTCESSGTYSASASGADWYTWSLTPSTAGSVASTGVITWNTDYSGSATLVVKAWNNGHTSANAPSHTENFNRVALIAFDGTLSVPSQNPCEGEVANYSVSTNSPATYEWYIGVDNNTVQATTSTFSTSQLSPDDAVIRVRITAVSGTACLTGSTSKILSSAVIHPTYGVTEKVHNVSISSPLSSDERCQAGGTDQFTASANTSYVTYSWSLTPASAGTISSSGLVTWDPNFHSQDAVIQLTGNGCGGSQATKTRTISVVKLPTVFNITGPTDLCRTHQSSLQLSGSEPEVNYQLYFRKSPTASWLSDDSISNASSWQIPIAHTAVTSNTGDYYVEITRPTCPVQSTPIHTINRIMPAPIVATSDTPNFIGCEGELVKVTASGGSNYKWYVDVSNTPGCEDELDPAKKVCRLELPGCDTNECWWQMQSGLPTTYYYATALDDPICQEGGSTEPFKFSVVEKLSLNKLDSDVEFICAGAAPTKFALSSTGPSYNSQWSVVTAGASLSTSEPASDTLQVTWDPNFAGTAEIKFVGEGCQGLDSISQFVTVYPVETNENSIRSYQAQQPFTRSLDLVTNMLQPDKVAVTTSYIDGLGRNNQNVSTKASPTQKDIVEVKRYDDYGRESIRYLPYTDAHSLAYRSTALDDQLNFYDNGSNTVAQDDAPFSVTQFEASPLNRPLKQGAPGTAWQPTSTDPYNLTDHTVKNVYNINAATDVIWFAYDPATGMISSDDNSQIKYYPAGTLLANETLDEANNSVIEYTDKEGRTLCKKVQHDEVGGVKQYASTYYIYDDLGNLVMVLPPEAVNSALSQLTGN